MEPINDSRYFLNFLNNVSDDHMEKLDLIESVRDYYIQNTETITDSQRHALKTLPSQFITKIKDSNGWTTPLHIWAEQGVKELLTLDPLILCTEDEYGYTVLHSLVKYCLGTYTNQVDYDMIKRLLDLDMHYDLVVVNPDTKEFDVEETHAIHKKDLNNKSYIDYLIDYAWALDIYDGMEQDEQLKQLLKEKAST